MKPGFVSSLHRHALMVVPLVLLACSKPAEVRQERPLARGPVQVEVEAPAEAVPSSVVERLRANFRKVHFGFDRADLDASSRGYLQANAELLKRHESVKVLLEGHTDHFGTTEYNLALGDRRARAVARYLSDLGVTTAQLEVTSLGKERPIVGRGDKDQVAPDRRVEFMVLTDVEGIESSHPVRGG